MRRGVTATMVVAGILLMVIGYFGAAPWGADTVANSDPKITLAPTLFVLGVIVVFSAAIVYELLPDRERR